MACTPQSIFPLLADVKLNEDLRNVLIHPERGKSHTFWISSQGCLGSAKIFPSLFHWFPQDRARFHSEDEDRNRNCMSGSSNSSCCQRIVSQRVTCVGFPYWQKPDSVWSRKLADAIMLRIEHIVCGMRKRINIRGRRTWRYSANTCMCCSHTARTMPCAGKKEWGAPTLPVSFSGYLPWLRYVLIRNVRLVTRGKDYRRVGAGRTVQRIWDPAVRWDLIWTSIADILCSGNFRISVSDSYECLYSPATGSANLKSGRRGQSAQNISRITTIAGKWDGKGCRQLQREHAGIDFHRARILMANQCLNDFLWLPVIEHMHDVAVPEGMGRHRYWKMHPVSFGPLHCLLQPVTHGFIGDGP